MQASAFGQRPVVPSSAEQLAHLCCGRYWPRLLRAHTGSVAAGSSATGVFSSARHRTEREGRVQDSRQQDGGDTSTASGSFVVTEYSAMHTPADSGHARSLPPKPQCRCLSPFGWACLHPTASTSTRPPAQRDIVMPTPAELSTTWRLSIISSCIAFLRIAIGRLLLCFPLSFGQTNAGSG